MANIYFFSKQNAQQVYDCCEAILKSNSFYNIATEKEESIAIYVSEEISLELECKLTNVDGFIRKLSTNSKMPALSEMSPNGFTYNGIKFGDEELNIIAGLNAIDNIKNVESVFRFLNSLGLSSARAGVYKPRTNPYSFQGLGASILNDLFFLADKYNIKAIAIEVLNESHVDEVCSALEQGNYKVGVILQIGTRNAQNFELLKCVGKTRYPILYKRGFGISLLESMQACEYIAKNGNNKIIFCLRGLKSIHASPHRNICDFSQLPALKRMINVVTCSDPSHSVGNREYDHNQIMDIAHVTAQAVISGTNSLLIDIHPNPKESPVDSNQILNFQQFSSLLDDINICRMAFINRKKLYSNELIKKQELDHFVS